MLFRFSEILRNPNLLVLVLLIAIVLPGFVSGDEKTGRQAQKTKTEIPECFFEEMNRLEQEVAYLRLALKKSRDHLHMAHVELGAKAEAIMDLETELCDLSGELESFKNRRVNLTPATELTVFQVGGDFEDQNNRLIDQLDANQFVIPELSLTGAVQNPATSAFYVPPTTLPFPQETEQSPSIAPIIFAKKTMVNRTEQERIAKECKTILANHPGAKIRMTGHADDFSFPGTNLVVSVNRAAFLARDLKSLGVPRNVLIAEGKGDREPSPVGNRRVEIEIILP